MRYDVLLGMSGEEFQSVLKIDSAFNDNDEKVEYNLVLKLHQGQSYLDSEGNDPELFKKIDHIRDMFNGFKKSDFYQSLAGCTKVKSPISRTNLIVKNPYFKKCYELWYFIEKYTAPGYSIEKRQYDGKFSPEYVDELNTIILFNYLTMKNSLDEENNKPVDVTKYKKKRTIKPKFIKRIIEEFVSDYDIPEKQLKNIFEKEISKAYDARKKQEEEIRIALVKALNSEIKKKETEEKEEQILSLLRNALSAGTGETENREEQRIINSLGRVFVSERERIEEGTDDGTEDWTEDGIEEKEMTLDDDFSSITRKSEETKKEEAIMEALARVLKEENDINNA